MIVVDANVMILALASPTDKGDAARAVLTSDDLWFAPAHMPLEVIRALRKAVVGGQLAEPDALAAFGALMLTCTKQRLILLAHTMRYGERHRYRAASPLPGNDAGRW